MMLGIKGLKCYKDKEEMIATAAERTKFYTRKKRGEEKYRLDKAHKEKDRVKTMAYQKICDEYKKNMSKKGKGRMKKIKGKVLPTPISCNDACTKSWRYVGYGSHKPLKEGFKHYAIYDIT